MKESSLSSRLIVGALAGLTATTFMTAAMRRLHARLPAIERYPLPPREITERLLPEGTLEAALQDASLLAHFGYGAASGALIAATGIRKGDAAGAALGVGIWAASYFGWVPAFRILAPAEQHPPRRNALMIGAHLVWGAFTSWTIRELTSARRSMLAGGPLRDAQAQQARSRLPEEDHP